MELIVCVSDGMGVAFNHRRQSRDRAVAADIAASLQDRPLSVLPVSVPLFASQPGLPLCVVASAAELAPDAVFFSESDFLPASLTGLTLYFWNRRYPADTYFRFDPAANGFRLLSQTEFPGFSHENLRKECWAR